MHLALHAAMAIGFAKFCYWPVESNRACNRAVITGIRVRNCNRESGLKIVTGALGGPWGPGAGAAEAKNVARAEARATFFAFFLPQGPGDP